MSDLYILPKRAITADMDQVLCLRIWKRHISKGAVRSRWGQWIRRQTVIDPLIMWRDSYRAWFYISIAAAIIVSVHTRDIYWLIIEVGMVAAMLGRWPLFDQPEEPELQRPLTVFMVFPFTVYILQYIVGHGNSLPLRMLGFLTTMMATLLLCLFLVLILVKRTDFHMNYRFILGFSTVTAISLASLFTFLSTSYGLMKGEDVSNADLMWSLIGVLFFGIVSGALFRRDMRRMDYGDLLKVGRKEEAT